MEDNQKKEINDVVNQNSALQDLKKTDASLNEGEDKILRKIEELNSSFNELKRDAVSEKKMSQAMKEYAKTVYTNIKKDVEESNKKDISEINENINETKKINEEILSNINSLLEKLPETERKSGEIEALYKKERENSVGKDNRIKELNNDLEKERGRSSQLDKSLSEKDSELNKLKASFIFVFLFFKQCQNVVKYAEHHHLKD